MKKGRKTIDNRIAEITSMAHLISKRGKHCVFTTYSGHVKLFCVDIHMTPWEPNADSDLTYQIFLNGNKNVFSRLGEIRAKLNSLLKNSR